MAQDTPARRTTSIPTAGLTFGAVTAALTAGWVGVVVLVVAGRVTVVALCWVLADGGRSQPLCAATRRLASGLARLAESRR